MSSILRISEAAALALHSMAFMAANPDGSISTREIAEELRVSEAHLSKVLQRLAKAGLVKSVRGPKGGFKLGKSSDEISLLDIYESIDGPFVSSGCLFDTPVYGGENCILGDLLGKIDRLVSEYMAGTTLSKVSYWGRRYERQVI